MTFLFLVELFSKSCVVLEQDNNSPEYSLIAEKRWLHPDMIEKPPLHGTLNPNTNK